MATVAMNHVYMSGVNFSAIPGPTDPYWNNVALLLHFDGTNGSSTFTDSSSNNVTMNTTRGTPTLSTAQQKFGPSSFGALDTGLIFSDSLTSLQPVNDWTIEFWAYRPSQETFSRIFNLSGGNGPQLAFLGELDTMYVIFAGNSIGTITDFFTSQNLLNTWVHIAMVRYNNVISVYRNGVSVFSATNSYNTYNTGMSMIIGGFENGDNTQYWNGYIDEFRYTTGVARYTANFTPPTEPFPNQ